MNFPTRIRELRKERRLAQKSIADYLGITRQAIAAYENNKREPGYETLCKLADYFNVSTDYLLGRVGSKEVEAYTIGQNIKLIRGEATYEEFATELGERFGTLILPDILKLYETGERKPIKPLIKVLASYGGVSEEFFYNSNTQEDYRNEKELSKNEKKVAVFFENIYEKDADVEYEELAQKMDIPVDKVKNIISMYKQNSQ